MKKEEGHSKIEKFYQEQLSSQRGMLASAIEELRIKSNFLPHFPQYARADGHASRIGLFT